MSIKPEKETYMIDNIFESFARQQGYFCAEITAAEDAYRRRHRLSHPPGTFDKAGRFSLEERGPCCDAIRAPSRAHPYPEMGHGRSLTHVACVHGVEKLYVQRLVKALEVASEHAAASEHEKAQLLVKLRHILKPALDEPARPGDGRAKRA